MDGLKRLFGGKARPPEPEDGHVPARAPPSAPRAAPPARVQAQPIPEPSPQAAANGPTYGITSCPYCGVIFDPPPKGDSKCKACGSAIRVRKGLDGEPYLLREEQVEAIDQNREAVRWSATRSVK